MPDPQTNPTAVTELLAAHNSGDARALEQLFPLVYAELRRLANHYLRNERQGHTLQPTALVHEAYLRLVDQDVAWEGHAHFLGITARVMRQILVDHARQRLADKRGAGGVKLSLDEVISLSEERAVDLVALDDALKSLSDFDPQKCRLVELRYFAGLSVEETAQVLGLSVPTVVRHWRTAKAWLQHEISNR